MELSGGDSFLALLNTSGASELTLLTVMEKTSPQMPSCLSPVRKPF